MHSSSGPICARSNRELFKRCAVRLEPRPPKLTLPLLPQLGVPTFYRTRDPAALKKQARVMSVLLGFLDDEHDERD